MTKVARVVTVFNQWQDIGRWVQNTHLRQDGVTWCFVSDDPQSPPDDRMRKWIESLGLLLEPKCNLGRSSARNLGAAQTDSEWLDFVDGDDIPLPIPMEDLPSSDSADLLFFDQVLEHVMENGIQKPLISEREADNRFNQLNALYKEILGHPDPRPAAFMVSRKAFNQLHGFDGRTDGVEDVNFLLRARLLGLANIVSDKSKADYQKYNEKRWHSPNLCAGNLLNYKLALNMNVDDNVSRLICEQQNLWSRQILWSGQREMQKSGISRWLQLSEALKWICKILLNPRR